MNRSSKFNFTKVLLPVNFSVIVTGLRKGISTQKHFIVFPSQIKNAW